MEDVHARSTLHAQLERALLGQIERGAWSTGDRLPTESQLAATYKVSRNTVRTALAALEHRGLLERHAGRGTFLRHTQYTHLMGWHEEPGDEFANQGLAPAVRVVAFGDTVGDSADAARLGVPLGAPLLAVRRLFTVGGETTGMAVHRLPAGLAAALTERDYEALYPERTYRAAGVDVDRGTLLLTARAATPDEASMLGVAAGTPVFAYERTLYLADGRPFEWAQAILRADRARFRADFAVPRQDGAAPPSL